MGTILNIQNHAYIVLMRLTVRQKEVLEACSTIGREDICNKELASKLGIAYKTLMRHREMAMKANGYTSWDGFIADFVRDDYIQNVDSIGTE